MSKPSCVVPLCVALEREPGDLYCAVHYWQIWDAPAALGVALSRTAGLVAPLQPVTDRIEYDADGLPVRFYPEVRRG